MVWISVLEHAICSIMENPAGSSRATESQNHRENENKIRLTPNPAHVNATQRPRPLTPVFAASVKRAKQRAHARRAHQNAQARARRRAESCRRKIGISTV